MNDFLHFAEHTLQEVALAFMALVYAARLYWLFRFKGARDRQPATASTDDAKARGAAYSIATVAMPWAMESSRRMPLFYVQFIAFHLGVVAAIGLSFLIPYAPHLMESAAMVLVMRILIGAALVAACIRIARRVSSTMMRKISSPDDYFSLILLAVWFLFAFLAVPNQVETARVSILVFFLLTAFFLIYVPFSKISHYLYYPFMRYWIGKSLGHRGVFPMQRRVAEHAGAQATKR